MKVFGYCRVSNVEQANSDPAFLQEQRDQINQYATSKGWSVAEFFLEIGGFGPIADRLEGRRLLAALEPGDVVIAARLDNAWRAAADALDGLEQFKERQNAFHVVDLGGDITENAIQNMVLTIQAVDEREYIPERPTGQIIPFGERKPTRDE